MSAFAIFESGRFNSPFALILFPPTLIATLSPRVSYFLLNSLYFWFASATRGVKKRNFSPFIAFGTPASSPIKVFPLPVADTTSVFSPRRTPALTARY